MTEMQPSAEELWRDLCEKDDRTSPEYYPDMALISEDEFVSVCEQVAAAERARILALLRPHLIIGVTRMYRGGSFELIGYTCEVCKADWQLHKPERHAPSCALADEIEKSAVNAL